MKTLLFLLFSLITLNIGQPTETMSTDQNTLYDYVIEDIDGNKVPLDAYKGKVLLIVNVASKCGYTPQYEGLQNIYEAYNDKGLVVLGFPANNFMGQEPGTEEDIKQFCTLNYGVTFPMSSKVSVLGSDQDPLFSYLTTQSNQDFEGGIRWNFEKFLIDKEGKLQRRFRSGVEPESQEITKAIEALLNS